MGKRKERRGEEQRSKKRREREEKSIEIAETSFKIAKTSFKVAKTSFEVAKTPFKVAKTQERSLQPPTSILSRMFSKIGCFTQHEHRLVGICRPFVEGVSAEKKNPKRWSNAKIIEESRSQSAKFESVPTSTRRPSTATR